VAVASRHLEYGYAPQAVTRRIGGGQEKGLAGGAFLRLTNLTKERKRRNVRCRRRQRACRAAVRQFTRPLTPDAAPGRYPGPLAVLARACRVPGGGQAGARAPQSIRVPRAFLRSSARARSKLSSRGRPRLREGRQNRGSARAMARLSPARHPRLQDGRALDHGQSSARLTSPAATG